MSVATNFPIKPSSSKRRCWIPSRFRKFSGEEKGTAAIEMTFVLLPFTFMIGAIFELALQYFAHSIMQSAMADLSRAVRTNQINTGNFTAEMAKDVVCKPEFVMFNCDEMVIDVQEVATWNSPAGPDALPDGSVDPSGTGFNPGDRGTINIVRVYYPWTTVMTRFMNVDYDNARVARTRILVATDAFRIEPGSAGS